MRKCCAPGQIAVPNLNTFCYPPQTMVASNDGKCSTERPSMHRGNTGDNTANFNLGHTQCRGQTDPFSVQPHKSIQTHKNGPIQMQPYHVNAVVHPSTVSS
jgi:hypothetical protein